MTLRWTNWFMGYLLWIMIASFYFNFIGNKINNVTVLYTPWSNLKKTNGKIFTVRFIMLLLFQEIDGSSCTK